MTLQDALINNCRRKFEEEGVKAADIEKVIAQYPESIMPDYRKQRNYISSILAKNEIDSKNSYNSALFIRVERGYYCINPGLSVFVEDKWVNIYEFTGMNIAKKLTEDEKQEQLIDNLMDDIERNRKLNPEFAAEQDILLLDYKRRMEQIRDEKLGLANKTDKEKILEKSEKEERERERILEKEKKEQLAKQKAQEKKDIEKGLMIYSLNYRFNQSKRMPLCRNIEDERIT